MFEGQFIWRELSTPDPIASKAFYAALFGWTFEDQPAPGIGTYTLIRANGREIAGMLKDPNGAPHAHWNGYAYIEDVDAATARARKAGAQICMPPMDIPEVGRFSAVQDPGGAIFFPFKPGMAMPPDMSLEELAPKMNEFGWAELRARDLAQTEAFYQAAMNWTMKRHPVPRDECVTIAPSDSFLAVQSPLSTRASIGLTIHPDRPDSWLHYVQVASIHDVAAKVPAAGGKLLLAPVQVPHTGWVAIVLDPQGAEVALWSPTDPS